MAIALVGIHDQRNSIEDITSLVQELRDVCEQMAGVYLEDLRFEWRYRAAVSILEDALDRLHRI